MTKKIIALALCALALLGALSGCGQENEKTTVLCTVFPIYDWVRSVVGENENIEVRLLVSDGADLHSFQPTAKDAIAIRSADLIVRVGGADDSFVNELAEKGDGIDLRLMEVSGVTLRHSSVSSEHSREDEHGHGHDHEHATDEHIWLSLKNAIACVGAIRDALSSLDPERAESYRQNADAYAERLAALDGRYAEAVDASNGAKMVFADRFPFVYLTEDYGIEYEAAFEGCTTDAEAGFDTVLRLSERLGEWGLSHLFVTESSDGRLASSVAEAAPMQIEVVTLNSMQSVTADDIEGGTTYIGIMEENLVTLTTVLSR